MNWRSPRALNLTGFTCCAALLAYALYVQGVLRIDPCPLCIFQRVGIAAVGVLFLLAGIHAPRGWGAKVYGVLLALAALGTAAIAARHVWIQHLPEDQLPSCGAGLGFLLQEFPVTDVIRKVLTGSGECHAVNWTFLSLAMPTWVLIVAFALGALGVYANIIAHPPLGQRSGEAPR